MPMYGPLNSTFRSCLLLVCAACTDPLSAQGFALQYPITDPPFISGNVMHAPDGGLLVYYAKAPDRPFIRYDANGNPLWARKYTPAPSLSGFTPMPDGGVVVSGTVDYYLGDTARYSHMRLGPAGEVVWWRRYMLSGWPVPIGQAQLNGHVRMALDGGGGLFTVLEHVIGAVSGPTVLKCDTAGTLQWAVDLKEAPSWSNSVVIPDEQGGCHVALLHTGGTQDHFVLHRLDAAGALVWRRRFQINSPGTLISAGFFRNTDGSLRVGGWLNDGAYLLRIGADGTMEEALTYPIGPPEFPSAAELLALHTPEGHIRFGQQQTLTFSTAGDLLEQRLCLPVTYTIGADQYELLHHTHSADANGLVVVGHMRTWSTTTMDMRMGMVAARVPWDVLGDGCPIACTNLPTAPGSPLVNEAFVFVDEPHDGPHALYTYTITLPVFVTTAHMPPTFDPCLTLGTGGATPAMDPLPAWPNPIAAGELLNVQVSGMARIEVMDALGRLLPVDVSRTEDGFRIGTHTLAPGTYLLRRTDAAGSTVRVARFTVQ